MTSKSVSLCRILILTFKLPTGHFYLCVSSPAQKPTNSSVSSSSTAFLSLFLSVRITTDVVAMKEPTFLSSPLSLPYLEICLSRRSPCPPCPCVSLALAWLYLPLIKVPDTGCWPTSLHWAPAPGPLTTPEGIEALFSSFSSSGPQFHHFNPNTWPSFSGPAQVGSSILDTMSPYTLTPTKGEN